MFFAFHFNTGKQKLIKWTELSKEWNLYEKLAHLFQKYAIPPLQMNVQFFEWGGPDQIQKFGITNPKNEKMSNIYWQNLNLPSLQVQK